MSRTSLLVWAIVVAAVFQSSRPSLAGDADVVTGSGQVVIKRQPTLLRGQFIVTAEAKDLSTAIARLKEAQAAARQKLVDTGAVEKSISIGPIQPGGAPINARDQYAQYMQDLQQSMGRPAVHKPAGKSIAIVSSIIKAEWALRAANAEELLMAGSALVEKIRAAKISARDQKKLTPEELEAAEE